jgi:hypothetical protein
MIAWSLETNSGVELALDIFEVDVPKGDSWAKVSVTSRTNSLIREEGVFGHDSRLGLTQILAIPCETRMT